MGLHYYFSSTVYKIVGNGAQCYPFDSEYFFNLPASLYPHAQNLYRICDVLFTSLFLFKPYFRHLLKTSAIYAKQPVMLREGDPVLKSILGTVLLVTVLSSAHASDNNLEPRPIDFFGITTAYSPDQEIDVDWLAFMVDRFSYLETPEVTISAMLSLTVSYDDTYWVFLMSEQSGKDSDTIAKLYAKNPTRGWGYIAKVLSVKPGSNEFKNLKTRTDLAMTPGSKNDDDDGNSKGKGKR